MSDTYTTVSGDTWDLIAFNQLGSCDYTNLLIDANRDKIDTAIFSAGTVLNLPTIMAENTASANLPPWRRST